MGDDPRPLERVLREGGLEGPIPPGPRRGPVPGPHRNDPLPADPGRGHRRGERRAVREVPDPRGAGSRAPPHDRTADPADRVLSHEGTGRPHLRAHDPRPVAGGRAPRFREPRGPPGGRPQDRELRTRLRLRDPGHPGRHARPSDREPARGGADAHPSRDGGRPSRAARCPLLDPAQPAARPARPEPLPAHRAAMRRLSDRGVVRYREGSGGGATPAAASGRPARVGRRRARRVGGTNLSAKSGAATTSPRTVQAIV